MRIRILKISPFLEPTIQATGIRNPIKNALDFTLVEAGIHTSGIQGAKIKQQQQHKQTNQTKQMSRDKGGEGTPATPLHPP